MTQSATPRATTQNSRVPDIKPFTIEPLILARLYRARVRPAVVGIVASAIVLLFISWSALISNLFYRAAGKSSWQADLTSFLLHRGPKTAPDSLPYLSDYPSIILTITVSLSIYLVYALFFWASQLHSDMAKSDCIRFSQDGRRELANAVAAMNAKFARFGRLAPFTLLSIVGIAIALNFRLETRLFTFLGENDLYHHWWASLHPFRPGAVTWIVFGSIGIYMVYAESVLGLTYVKFLKDSRGAYQFRANMLNPDGLFGWYRLRLIISNLEVGVMSTLLSSWALSFYLQPSVGSVITVLVLTVFGGIVLYVFVSLTLNFRRHVKIDRDSQRAEIGQKIVGYSQDSDIQSLLGLLVSYKRLELVSKIPSVPVRRGWLVAGAVTVVVPITALVIQALSYFSGR